MPRDASGTFTRTNGVFQGSTVWAQQAASGDKTISSSRHDTHDQDEADGLSDSLSRSGKGGMQADLALTNFKLLAVAAGTAATDGINKGQLDAKIGAVVDDTSPQLGGDLDMNGFALVTLADADILLTPDGTGRFVTPRATLAGLAYPDADGTVGQLLETDGAGQISFVDKPASGPFTEWGESAELTISDSGAHTVAIGALTPALTGPPKSVTAYIICKSEDRGYAVGDKVADLSAQVPTGSRRGWNVWWSDSEVGVAIAQDGIAVHAKTGGGPADIANGSWRIVITAKR